MWIINRLKEIKVKSPIHDIIEIILYLKRSTTLLSSYYFYDFLMSFYVLFVLFVFYCISCIIIISYNGKMYDVISYDLMLYNCSN